MSMPLACVLFVLIASPASAQTFRGGIQGTVNDQSGAAVPGATVTVTSTGIGLRRTVQTDSSGSYFFSELPLGPYDVEAVLQGFATETRKSVDVAASASVRIDFELKPGSLTDTVVVT